MAFVFVSAVFKIAIVVMILDGSGDASGGVGDDCANADVDGI